MLNYLVNGRQYPNANTTRTVCTRCRGGFAAAKRPEARRSWSSLDGRYQRVRHVGDVVLWQSGVRGGRLNHVWPAAGRRRRLEQFGHEADVRDSQPECFDPGQTFLVRKRGHLAPELVKRLVQVVHAPALAYVGRAPLRQRGHAPSDFLRRRYWRLLQATAATATPIRSDTLMVNKKLRTYIRVIVE